MYGKPHPSYLPLGKESFGAQSASWELIGNPIPSNAQLFFQYYAFAGKNDSAGNQLSGTQDMDTLDIRRYHTGFAHVGIVRNEISPNNHCWPLSSGLYLKPLGKPDYAWLFIVASANFSKGLKNSNEMCSRVFKILEAGENGKVNISNPIMTEFYGE